MHTGAMTSTTRNLSPRLNAAAVAFAVVLPTVVTAVFAEIQDSGFTRSRGS